MVGWPISCSSPTKSNSPLEYTWKICKGVVWKVGVFYNLYSPDSRANSDGPDSEEVVDAETANWLVRPESCGDLDRFKNEYRVGPLCVYANDCFVEPIDVNNTIRGALVDVHFKLQHFHIRQKDYDSYNSSVEQVQIIQPGEACPVSPYKRAEFRGGPVPIVSKRQEVLPDAFILLVASSSNAPLAGEPFL